MTQFLASVVTAQEAVIACAGGADIIDFCAPARAGTLDMAGLRAVLAAVSGHCPVSVSLATVATDEIAKLGAMAVEAGATMLRVAVATDGTAAQAQGFAALAGQVRLVGVLHADNGCDDAQVEASLEALCGVCDALMLDMAGPGRLLVARDLVALQRFAARCAAAGMPVGFAGALEAPDVERLLLIDPAILGFRTALARNAPSARHAWT